MTGENRAVFVDVDGTLLTRNSGPLYARWLFRQRLMTLRDLSLSFYHALRYKLDLLDGPSFFETIARRMVGEQVAVHRERGRRFFQEVVKPLLRPSMLAALSVHRAEGHTIVILSASTPTLIEPLAEHLGITDVLCTRLEQDAAGCYTGRLAGTPCFGAGKLVSARAFCEQHGLELEEAVAYADSISDRPLLAAVGLPYVVEPDPLLRVQARRRAWPLFEDDAVDPARRRELLRKRTSKATIPESE